MYPGLYTAIVLSSVVGSGSWMVTQTRTFAPLRERILQMGKVRRPIRHRVALLWLTKLLCREYYTATALALVLVLVYRPVLLVIPYVKPGWSYWPLGYLVSVLAVNGTSMLWVLMIRRALDGRPAAVRAGDSNAAANGSTSDAIPHATPVSLLPGLQLDPQGGAESGDYEA